MKYILDPKPTPQPARNEDSLSKNVDPPLLLWVGFTVATAPVDDSVSCLAEATTAVDKYLVSLPAEILTLPIRLMVR